MCGAATLRGRSCRQLVSVLGSHCGLHGGYRRLSTKYLLHQLEKADLRCGNDQTDTKLILQGLIAHLRKGVKEGTKK